MTRHNIHIIFSLLFFFFSSFLFFSIICSALIDNFDNLLVILFRQNGLFYNLTMLVFAIGFFISIYFNASRKIYNIRYENFIFFGSCIFATLIIINILLNSYAKQDEIILDIYTYSYYSYFNSINNLLIDSIVFIYFILIPMLNFLYKEKIYKNYFYKTHLKDVIPSLNVSIICLFGYTIHIYNSYYVIDIILVSVCIIMFIRIAISSKEIVTFYTIINMLILIIGFMIFLFSKQLLSQLNLYIASTFFYSIALVFWYLNISLKLKDI